MTLGDLQFYDAAFPPSPPPAGMDGVAFYIGGDTPHVWTLAEIEASGTRFRLPIYVRSDPTLSLVQGDVAEALRQLGVIGAPKGTLVALDSETSINPNYVAQFYFGLRNGGYTLIDYGSASTLFGNHNPDGYYWAGDWTSKPHVLPGSQMTQWIVRGAYDESTALPTLPFWDTHISIPAPSPQPQPQPEIEVTVQLPQVHQGNTGETVRTVQVLCGRRGHFPANSGTPESPDGIFGAATHEAVVAVQTAAGFPPDERDGIVGPLTWPVLVNG